MSLSPDSVHPYGSFWLDVADKGIKALALVVGAVWTFFNVQRSRTYRRKLELGISGAVFDKNGSLYLLISCQLTNVGQTKYSIEQKGTYAGVFTIADSGDEKRIAALEIFKDHGWIEPGEKISEPLIAPVPDPRTFVALKLALRVVSEGIEWNASSIVAETAQRLAKQRPNKDVDRKEGQDEISGPEE